jgi:D-cysteine desulfhydrase
VQTTASVPDALRARPPGLSGAPRIRLAILPTPLQAAPRLSDALGIEVWVKRDDLTGVGLGGNKARKLEFLLGDARAWGADVVVTGGGPGSNHIQITAAAAARLGLDCLLVLYGDRPRPEPLNLRLARLAGAQVRFTGDHDRAHVDAGIDATVGRLERNGRRPYRIGRGGATAVGCLGYVEAAFELEEQLVATGLEPAMVVLATGSCGTQAGLALGAALTGTSWRLYGVSVSRPVAECRERIGTLALGAASVLGVGATLADIELTDGIGPGYGRPSRAGQAAASLAGRTEGLFLDPVFTAKAMAALVAQAQAGALAGPVVFLHSGGTGGLSGKGQP